MPERRNKQMKMYETLGRVSDLIYASATGDYDPTKGKNLDGMQAEVEAIISLAVTLDSIASAWDLDLMDIISKARKAEE